MDFEIQLESKKSCKATEFLVDLKVLANLENASVPHLLEVFSSKRYI